MRFITLILVASLLAGCTDTPDDEEPQGSPPETSTSTSTTTTQTTTTTPPGSNDDCKPVVEPHGQGYRASCTVSFDLKPSGTPELSVSTFNGAIDVAAGADRAAVHLWADGASEQDARDGVLAMQVTVAPSDILVRVEPTLRPNDGASMDITLSAASIGSAELASSNGDIDLALDADDVAAQTTNGGVDLDGDYDTVHVVTSNGDIDVVGSTDHAELRTTNAGIDVRGDHVALTLITSNGDIDVDARPTSSGHWELRTTNAGIDVLVPEDTTRGYDITARTTNADVTIDMETTEPVGTQTDTNRHERTIGYDQRDIQTTVDLVTSNGDVDVSAADGSSTT